ncbi:MAG: phosphatase PAP2 family protein [Bdellovibrionaceae bacterium]|nr:phosphatase PAP2 family protein [Pseudobdellovibrionaceae bacterium]
MPYPARRIITLTLLGITLSGISILIIDQPLSQYFRQPELLPLWLKARAITNIGLGDPYFMIAILIYIFAKWIRPQLTKWREFGRDFFFSLLGSGFLIHLIKFSFGRQRPHLSEDLNPLIFTPFTTDWNFHSFASGHTQVLFTVATMMSLTLPRWSWLYFSLATALGLTRVIIHDHFLSDFIGGAVVGYVGTITSVYFVHRWQLRSSKQN